MSLAAARLAPLANRTAVTAPLTVSAYYKVIPGLASSSGPAALQLKKSNAAAIGNTTGNQADKKDGQRESSVGSWVHAYSLEQPPNAKYFELAPGRRWSTGVKKAADGSLVSRTLFQAPTFPFGNARHLSTTSDTTNIPDFSKYKHKCGGHNETSRAFTYLMVGSMGTLTAVAAKYGVIDLLTALAPGPSQLALAKVEFDLNKVPLGKNTIIKWRGKPIFIRHRTAEEIQEANSVDLSDLRDKQTDAERVKDPAYLVMVGVCTHLGCIPIGEAGDYNGWFCPCHGSHYDISGRIRKGPAPLNLEIPPYTITPENVCKIG